MSTNATPCTYCGHDYVKPCNGDSKCPNYAHATKLKEKEAKK